LWNRRLGNRVFEKDCEVSFQQIYTVQFCYFLIFHFGDGNWLQAEAWNLLFAGAFEVNVLAQGLR